MTRDLTRDLTGERLYVDANVLIHLTRGEPRHAPVFEALMTGLNEARFTAATAPLTLTEMLVPAFRTDSLTEAALYRELIEASAITLIEPSRLAYVEAARLRAEFHLDTIDALHVAAALQADCTIFLTQDRKLRLPPSLTLLSLDDL